MIPPERSPQIVRLLTWAAGLLGIAAVVLLFRVNLIHFDDGFDFLSYHLPFGIKLFDPDRILLHPLLEERFQGFPLLIHAFIGLVWLLVPLIPPNAFHMLGLVLFLLMVLAAVRAMGTGASWFLLGSLACPMVLIHCRSGYIDLPANLFLTFGIVSTIQLLRGTGSVRRWSALGTAGYVLAGCTKFQLIPPALLGAGILAFLVIRNRRLTMAFRGVLVVALLAGAPFWLARNLVLHHNPVFPMKPPVLQSVFPYLHDADEDSRLNRPAAMRDSPQWLRTLASVFEVMRAVSPKPGIVYTHDQWGAGPESEGFRMGGFWRPLILFHLVLLVWGVKRRILPPPAAFLFLAFFGITLVLPQSHELRYYLFIPLVLAWLTAATLSHPNAGSVCIAFMIVLILLSVRSFHINAPHLAARKQTMEDVAQRFGIHWNAMTPGADYCGRNTANVLVLLTGPSLREFRVRWAGTESPCPEGHEEFVGAFFVFHDGNPDSRRVGRDAAFEASGSLTEIPAWITSQIEKKTSEGGV